MLKENQHNYINSWKNLIILIISKVLSHLDITLVLDWYPLLLLRSLSIQIVPVPQNDLIEGKSTELNQQSQHFGHLKSIIVSGLDIDIDQTWFFPQDFQAYKLFFIDRESKGSYQLLRKSQHFDYFKSIVAFWYYSCSRLIPAFIVKIFKSTNCPCSSKQPHRRKIHRTKSTVEKISAFWSSQEYSCIGSQYWYCSIPDFSNEISNPTTCSCSTKRPSLKGGDETRCDWARPWTQHNKNPSR